MNCECREGHTCNACWVEQEKNYDEYMMDVFIEGATSEALGEQMGGK